ncbi:SigB/SigF/SigG family RNA polymerase sigma factor [Nocardia sp. NPDC003345]
MAEPSGYTRPPPSASAQRSHRGRDPYDDLEPALGELAALDSADPARTRVREEIIDRCLPLADHIARRYAGRGIDFDDLLQVARLGAVNAVDRYDPAVGTQFLAFAVPTMLGEVRRYFRDQGWAVRVPRRMKELQARISAVTPALTQEQGRVPSARELAAVLDTTVEEITQAMIAANSYTCDSLDGVPEANDSGDGASPVDRLGETDPHYSLIEDAEAVGPLIARLPETERRVLLLRYYEDRTQSQIAAVMGCSQMHISRMLTRVARTLREQALAEPGSGKAA